MADPEVIERLNTALEGRYRIERELGAGGMATVYLARDAPRRVILVQNFFEELRRLTAADSGR